MVKLLDIWDEILFEWALNSGIVDIVIDTTDYKDLFPLTEGKWKQTEYNGYVQRTEVHNNGLRHTHVAHEKHRNAKNKQVAWNADKTRHDKLTFNTNFVGLEKAKEIARKALNLPPDAQLESVNQTKGKLLLESITDNTGKCTYIFKLS